MTLEGFRVSGEKIKINLPLTGGTQPLGGVLVLANLASQTDQ